MIENIDCISFKRECGAEPQAIVAREHLLNHQQDCASCADFYQTILALDLQLVTAFKLPINNSSVEQQLSEVSQAATTASSWNVSVLSKKATQKYRPWMAAAASVLVASIGVFALQYPVTTFANDVIEHIHHEPGLLTLPHAITSPEQVQMVLQQANISLDGSNIEVLAAKLCPLDGQLAAHLVVRGESGPVTVLILPEKRVRAKRIKSKDFNGRILSAEHGAIAVVGGKKEDPDYMQQVVYEAFHWQD